VARGSPRETGPPHPGGTRCVSAPRPAGEHDRPPPGDREPPRGSPGTVHGSTSGSARIGGILNLILYSPAAASKAYYAGCSFGTGPIPIDTRRIDLSPDILLFLSTSGLLPTVFSSFAGLLDASGNGKASIVIPNAPALVGLKLRNAFLTIDAMAPSGVLTISNTCAFTIQK